jgi:hypothetical protein
MLLGENAHAMVLGVLTPDGDTLLRLVGPVLRLATKGGAEGVVLDLRCGRSTLKMGRDGSLLTKPFAMADVAASCLNVCIGGDRGIQASSVKKDFLAAHLCSDHDIVLGTETAQPWTLVLRATVLSGVPLLYGTEFPAKGDPRQVLNCVWPLDSWSLLEQFGTYFVDGGCGVTGTDGDG